MLTHHGLKNDKTRQNAWFQPSNRYNCDVPVSTYSFKCNLYRYNVAPRFVYASSASHRAASRAAPVAAATSLTGGSRCAVVLGRASLSNVSSSSSWTAPRLSSSR
jgi:hypothetical protein